jgi:hypothetical protein
MAEVIDAAIPAGWYNARIDHSVKKPTRDGSGSYLQLRFEVLDGPYQGRKLLTRLNLVSQYAQVKELAYKQLNAIRRAVGVPDGADSQHLHGTPLAIKVKIKHDANEVVGYRNF